MSRRTTTHFISLFVTARKSARGLDVTVKSGNHHLGQSVMAGRRQLSGSAASHGRQEDIGGLGGYHLLRSGILPLFPEMLDAVWLELSCRECSLMLDHSFCCNLWLVWAYSAPLSAVPPKRLETHCKKPCWFYVQVFVLGPSEGLVSLNYKIILFVPYRFHWRGL